MEFNDLHIPYSNNSDKSQKYRSLPSSRPFRSASILFILSALGLLTASVAAVLWIRQSSFIAFEGLILAIVFTILMWITAYFKRREAFCPLCKGTPLLDCGAIPHSKSKKIFPFNRGITATLSVATKQKFCCMYCGSEFDLLKNPKRHRGTKIDIYK